MTTQSQNRILGKGDTVEIPVREVDELDNLVTLLEGRIQQVTDIRDIQGAKETIAAGEYMRGMYNGLELALATLQGRDPEYK